MYLFFKLVILYTVSALIQYAHSILLNEVLVRIQFKFCANLRILFKKIAQKVDFLPKNAHSIGKSIRCVVNSNVVLY